MLLTNSRLIFAIVLCTFFTSIGYAQEPSLPAQLLDIGKPIERELSAIVERLVPLARSARPG